MIAVTLPWPSAKLNPNRSKGFHWAVTSALRKSARLEAWALARAATSKQQGWVPGILGNGAVSLTITFMQPDRRARDRDNLLAALKPSLDGLADALGVNDSQFEPITIRREYGSKPGAVRIQVGREA